MRELYEREAVSILVVELTPSESWEQPPQVYEGESDG